MGSAFLPESATVTRLHHFEHDSAERVTARLSLFKSEQLAREYVSTLPPVSEYPLPSVRLLRGAELAEISVHGDAVVLDAAAATLLDVGFELIPRR